METRTRILKAGRIALLVLLCLGFFTEIAQADVTSPPRLVIDNQTNAPVAVYAWIYNGRYWDWRYVLTVRPHFWNQVTGVQEGARFRVVKSSGQEEHAVHLGPGPQDVWVIR